MLKFKPRHYHYCDSDDPSKYQIDSSLQERVIRVSKEKPVITHTVQRLAHTEYEKQHSGQSYERMQQRGGLSVLEIVRLLADHVERLQTQIDGKRYGDKTTQTKLEEAAPRMREVIRQLAPWASAGLDDDSVCDALKEIFEEVVAIDCDVID